ncbi:MAG: discoidin domain-containing protein [Planctomycetes bacterium]|nr:discoidin domain-containing protein [Planctomycetota bacterium]
MYKNQLFRAMMMFLLIVLSGTALGQNIPEGGWIGNVTLGDADVGDATGDGGVFTVTGNGTDIQGTADHGQFLYKEMVGDGSMSCRVTDVGTGASNWAKGGIMVRQSTDAGSRSALMPITPGDGNGSSYQWRLDNGGGTNYTNNGTPAVAPPYYVKIERIGDEFTGSFSPDGIVWTQLGATQTIAMGETCLIGLAVTSHTGGELRTYTFDNLGFTGGVEGLADPGNASDPVHEDEMDDGRRDHVLSWAPGQYPGKHNVYIGSSFEDVNNATVPTASNLDATSYDPGRLDFGQTYFWRVDEVNATADKTVYRGDVWSFTAEPYSIQIPGAAIAVTASSQSNEFSAPDKAIDGSGLGSDGTHSMSNSEMWFTAAVDLDPWIQFEFEDAYKMDAMTVWNSNSAAETAIGWGVKDIEIQVSTDGETWDVLTGPHQLSRASGLPTYDQADTVPFNGVAAKYVRLNIQSNWGGLLMSYGLSEVQFTTIPAQARTPEPASGAVDVLPDATLTWRAGREAAEHVITISTDVNAVIDGSAPSVTTNVNSLSLGDIGGELGQTYYWRVNEVNEAEARSVWTGPVWSFGAADALVVDDFEGYNNGSPDRPFQTWLDGFGYSADEFFPVTYPGNGTGSGIGHDIWSLASPYYDGEIMESLITMEGSDQSMPFYYDNSGGGASAETTANIADLQVGQDWSQSGIQTLTLHFRAESLSEALDTTYDLTTEGDSLWFSQDVNSIEDGDAARSGALSNNVQSSMQTTVSGPGTVSFYWKVSSELDWDFLDFYIDGAMQDQISGEVDWEQKTYQITGAGSHTLEWRYTKDQAVFGGLDAGWVDKLEWDGAGQPATAPGNTGQLYAKINGAKVTYPGSVGDVKWTAWQIDLTSLGMNLQNVTSLTIGVEGNNASGVLYFDNFWLQPGE